MHLVILNELLQGKSVRRLLEDIAVHDARLEVKKQQIEEIESVLKSATASKLNDVKVQTSFTNNADDKVIDLISREAEILGEQVSHINYKACMYDLICLLGSEKYINVLYRKYFLFESYRIVAAEMNVSESWAKNMGNNAIKELENIVKKTKTVP